MRVLILPILLTIATAGCSDREALNSTREQLASCGLLTDGEGSPELPFYMPDGCYDECLARGSCEELSSALCGSSIELLVRCDVECAFTCPDGSLLALERICDGEPQCEGGADEIDCPVFTCDDGSFIPEAQHCDGWSQCPRDDSDERDCDDERSEVFECDGGLGMHPSVVCNGFEDCRDGSDELGCRSFQCTNGYQSVPLTQRCDGWRACDDGSDEDGCAELVLSCEAP